MAWYNEPGRSAETVLYTRVRLSRNLREYPFPTALEPASANEVLEKVSPLLEETGFRKINFSDISSVMATSYVERQYVSPRFASINGPHALFLREKPDVAVAACGEDHLQIGCILPGLSPKEAFSQALETERRLDREFELAYDEKLGYLTQSPADIGTGLSASVLLFLPALGSTPAIGALTQRLGKLGFSLRGGLGEGIGSLCGLYELSNRITLGKSEEELLSELEEAALQISARELEARRTPRKEELDKLSDRLLRSEAILRSALLLPTEEFLRLFSDVRLGVALAIIQGISLEHLSALLVEGMPATLTLSAESAPRSEHARQRLRAQRVKTLLHERQSCP